MLRAEAVVIGASAGGIAALSVILPALDEHFPLPIMIVLHLPPQRDSLVVELFSAKCRLTVKEAEDKEPLQPGVIYFAPPDYHLLVEADRHLALSCDEPVHFSRPAIDVLFESAADTYGAAVIGIILSGANEDGAQGLQVLEAAGGVALVQAVQEASSPVMPQAALAACSTARELTLLEIARFLQQLGGE